MAYRVSLSGPAESDAYAAFERIREAAPKAAERWLARLFEAISSLEEMPTRCPVIAEAEELGFPARHLLFGKGRGTYRVIFHIVEDEQHVGCYASGTPFAPPSLQVMSKIDSTASKPPAASAPSPTPAPCSKPEPPASAPAPASKSLRN